MNTVRQSSENIAGVDTRGKRSPELHRTHDGLQSAGVHAEGGVRSRGEANKSYAHAAGPLHPAMQMQQALGNQAVHRRMQSGLDPSSVHGIHHQPIVGNQGVSRRLQAKLKVNAPGDQYEQEADRVAEQVMRISEPRQALPAVSSASGSVQRKCACGGTCSKCQSEQSEHEHEHLQMKSAGPNAVAGIAAPPIVHDVLRSPGQPLDPTVRAFMEPRFRHDFSNVRVHADDQAAESARFVNANAYTVGHDVIFARGNYAPGSEAGRLLLAHELTHVIQQSSPSSGVTLQRQPSGGSSTPMTPLDVVAERIARLALGPKQASIQSGLPKRGPVVTVVRNKLTGEIFVGLNTGVPDEPTDLIRARIEGHMEDIGKGKVKVVHTDDWPGSHAEVNALDSAIAAREQEVGHTLTDEELDVFEMHNVWLSGGDRKLTTAPRCEHCASITRGVPVTDSMLTAESAGAGGKGGTGSGESGSGSAVDTGAIVPESGATPEPVGSVVETSPPRVAGVVAGIVVSTVIQFMIAIVMSLVLEWIKGQVEEAELKSDMRALEPQIAARLQELEPTIRQLQQNGKIFCRTTYDYMRHEGSHLSSTEEGMPVLVSWDNYGGVSLTNVEVSSKDTGVVVSKDWKRAGIDEKHRSFSVSTLLDDPEKRRRAEENARISLYLCGKADCKPPTPKTPAPQAPLQDWAQAEPTTLRDTLTRGPAPPPPNLLATGLPWSSTNPWVIEAQVASIEAQRIASHYKSKALALIDRGENLEQEGTQDRGVLQKFVNDVQRWRAEATMWRNSGINGMDEVLKYGSELNRVCEEIRQIFNITAPSWNDPKSLNAD